MNQEIIIKNLIHTGFILLSLLGGFFVGRYFKENNQTPAPFTQEALETYPAEKCDGVVSLTTGECIDKDMLKRSKKPCYTPEGIILVNLGEECSIAEEKNPGKISISIECEENWGKWDQDSNCANKYGRKIPVEYPLESETVHKSILEALNAALKLNNKACVLVIKDITKGWGGDVNLNVNCQKDIEDVSTGWFLQQLDR